MDREPSQRPVRIVQVNDRQPRGVQRCLAASSRHFVGLMEDGCNVLKYPHCKTQNAMEALYEEAARYKHLGPHNNLVVFKGVHEHGLLFEYCGRGQLEDVIREQPSLSDKREEQLGSK